MRSQLLRGAAKKRGATGGGTGDQYWANVVYLHNFDTASTTDATGKTASLINGASISGGSLVLGGSGDLLWLDNQSNDFGFGTGDFTIEFVSTKSASGYENYDAVCDTSSGGYSGVYVETSSNSGFRVTIDAPDMPYTEFTRATTVNDGIQHYWAVRKVGTSLALWKDGAQLGATFSCPGNLVAYSRMTIGSMADSLAGRYTFNGSINAIRITKGIARDVSAIPTLPFPTS